MRTSLFPIIFCFFLICSCSIDGKEYHVSPVGDDTNQGNKKEPLKTISAAALLAEPGDIITVHQGVYREEINPTSGGTSDAKRIVYRAFDGDTVVVKGSESIKGWERVQGDTWKVEISNSFFGDFNPYQDLISGDWFSPRGRQHHTGAVYLNGHWLVEAAEKDEVFQDPGSQMYWFAESQEASDGLTTIWAQFKGCDPNIEDVEINVRQAVFYPRETGVNYITIKGFVLEQAATPWAPPTAEQIGLIGTNWSKGWIIEDNIVRYSTCVGIALGKHGDEFDNTSANSAEGYVKTIERGLAQGWSSENIGHHIVRNNEIAHCEQAGIVGSLGPVFCEVYGNEIHDIHFRQLFTGAEMAGIKFHAAVDTKIWGNHIYRCNRGIWLDWMAQGTRVSQNLLHDNGPSEDLFLEVNHGPTLIDNNIMISANSLLVNSQGAAYVHNLIAGRIYVIKGERRLTPHLENHSTKVAGLAPNKSGDERFYNNILSGVADLGAYDDAVLPVWMDGNIYLNGAKPGKAEPYPQLYPDVDPEIDLYEKKDGWYLEISLDERWASEQLRKIIKTDLLGLVEAPQLPYVQANDKPYSIDMDYLGEKRSSKNVFPGPFVPSTNGKNVIRVWWR